MSTESPQPSSYEGAADLNDAADILAREMEAELPDEDDDSPNPDRGGNDRDEDDAASPEADPDEDGDDEDTDPDDDGEDADDTEQPDAEEDPDEDEEDPDNQLISVTVQGETKKVTLDELRAGYMMHEDYSRKSREVAQQRRELYEQRAQVQQATQAQLQEIGFLANELMTQVIGQEQALTDELRHSDPAEYAALDAEIRRKREMLSRAFQAHQQAQQSGNQFQGEMLQRHLAEQRDLLLSKVPEWSNPERATKERAQLAEYLISQGFHPQEVKTMADHRAVVLGLKAMQFDKLQQDRTQAKKKVKRPVPKLRKSRANSDNVSDQRRKKAKRRLAAEGSLDSAVEYLLAGS